VFPIEFALEFAIEVRWWSIPSIICGSL